MSGLDDLFQTQEDVDLSYAARTWVHRIRGGQSAVVEVVRRRSGLSYGPTKLRIIFNENDVQGDDWDTHLSEVLASEKVKAVSEANEVLRLALMLADWSEYPAQRFGDDYFNSVLAEYLKNGSLGAEPDVRDILSQIHESAPYKESPYYADCLNEVKAILQRGAQMLTRMGYARPDAERILVRAVAQFLDDRFGLTNRRMLGLL